MIFGLIWFFVSFHFEEFQVNINKCGNVCTSEVQTLRTDQIWVHLVVL